MEEKAICKNNTVIVNTMAILPLFLLRKLVFQWIWIKEHRKWSVLISKIYDYDIYEIFPHGSVGRESACNAGDPGLITGSERSPGEGNGNTLQYSCLENPMDGGAWLVIVYGFSRVGHD